MQVLKDKINNNFFTTEMKFSLGMMVHTRNQSYQERLMEEDHTFQAQPQMRFSLKTKQLQKPPFSSGIAEAKIPPQVFPPGFKLRS